MINKNINKTWLKELKSEFTKPYFLELEAFLKDREKNGAVIFPKQEDIFNALNYANFEDIKVVILGQDPYHGPNQAHGLSFSVQEGVKIPPSLRNIYKELSSDLNIQTPDTGYLESWAKQGVLMINAVFTVEQAKPDSHKKQGWENFTDQIIKTVAEKHNNIVFILWGGNAHKKANLIDETKHLILKDVHPSPLSASRGFFGSKPFSKTNNYLIEHKKQPINWKIENTQMSLF